ncbi:MAG: 50S ribosomal protein L35 [Luteitalea sp.]|nr:50S ribosomal protein L35 [Luteitalea sp.]
MQKAKGRSKLKTHRGAAKRFKTSARGKVMRNTAFHRHLLTGKPQHRKRQQRGAREVSPSDAARIKRMLPYE